MSDTKKNQGDAKPQGDTHATGTEDEAISLKDTHATGGGASTTSDTHATSEPAK